jgi:hypothetical protein
MGLPAIQNWNAYRGDTLLLEFVWKAGTTGSSSPVDLTGHTGRLQIRDALGNQVAEFTTGGGTLVYGGTLGTAAATCSYTQTGTMTQCGYGYDWENTAGAVRTTVVRGSISFEGDTTR